MTQSQLRRRSVLVGGMMIAACLAVGPVRAQNGVAGAWNLEVDSPQGMMKVTLTVAVDGDTIKGTIGGAEGETPIKGTTKDNTIAFSFDYAGPQGSAAISATAAVTGDDIKGEMDYGMGTAPFAGKRASK